MIAFYLQIKLVHVAAVLALVALLPSAFLHPRVGARGEPTHRAPAWQGGAHCVVGHVRRDFTGNRAGQRIM